MSAVEAVQEVESSVWRALADPSRRRILDLLRDRPQTTGELCAAFEVSRFAVMKHIAVLEGAGLIGVRRRGRERWNYLNAVPLRESYERWMRPYTDRWASSLLRLREHAEEGTGMATTGVTESRVEVLDIAQDVRVAGSAEAVFDALLDMDAWWPLRFREGATVLLEPEIGGRYWEDWGQGDGALYATVVAFHRPVLLGLRGPHGMEGPVNGVITYELEPVDGGTVVRLSHRVVGLLDDATRAGYIEGWPRVLAALRLHAESPTAQG